MPTDSPEKGGAHLRISGLALLLLAIPVSLLTTTGFGFVGLTDSLASTLGVAIGGLLILEWLRREFQEMADGRPCPSCPTCREANADG